MNNFDYYCPTKILFGRNKEALVGQEAAQFGKKVLLHYGTKSAEKSGLLDIVRKSLCEAGLEVWELGGVQPNPRSSLVYQGVEIAKREGIELILAVGGGSVIDSAKAIAVGAPYQGDFFDFYSNDRKAPTEALPVGVVLTLPGAGSESSDGSVITNDTLGTKTYCNSDLIKPVFAILNPEWTRTVSVYQTTCGMVDAFAHVVERYFTNDTYVDLTDRLCESVMKTLIKYSYLIQKDPENYDYRAEIMLACKVAHDDSVGIGRTQDWASHNMEHQLSALYDVAHGAGLAVIMPAWMKYVYKTNPSRFVKFGKNVMGVEMDIDFDEAGLESYILETIEAFENWLSSIQMPTRLGQLCPVKEEEFATMADLCLEFCGESIGGLKKLGREDIIQIYNLAK